MSFTNVRQQAVQSIAKSKPELDKLSNKNYNLREIFGSDVFNEEVQRARLPKSIYKALQKNHQVGRTVGTGCGR